jgi:hypothetical protein
MDNGFGVRLDNACKEVAKVFEEAELNHSGSIRPELDYLFKHKNTVYALRFCKADDLTESEQNEFVNGKATK